MVDPSEVTLEDLQRIRREDPQQYARVKHDFERWRESVRESEKIVARKQQHSEDGAAWIKKNRKHWNKYMREYFAKNKKVISQQRKKIRKEKKEEI